VPEIERWIGNNQRMKREEDERKNYQAMEQKDQCVVMSSRVEYHRGLWDEED
jgi:hypothetical protein